MIILMLPRYSSGRLKISHGHVAVVREADGRFKLYQDGELVSDASKKAPQKLENVRIAWTKPGKGTAGALSEYRIWKVARTADDIRREFDRTYAGRAMDAVNQPNNPQTD